MNNPLLIELKTVCSGFDGKTCWVNPMAGVLPNDPQKAILIGQKLLTSHADCFFGLNISKSQDNANSWEDFQAVSKMENRPNKNGETSIAGMNLNHLKDTTKFLSIGCDVAYFNNHEIDTSYRRSIVYTIFDSINNQWTDLKKVKLPTDLNAYSSVCAINSQIVFLDNGDIAIPAMLKITNSSEPFGGRYAVVIICCKLNGEELVYRKHGKILTVDTDRGLYEPSLIYYGGRYLLTLRNDESGYVTSGETPFDFEPPQKWIFDDGKWLGNYNTQQHWLTLGNDLYLVYTRKGLNNDHVFRHRAPLLIAKVDPDTLTVIRKTEQIVVPERGARLGNFGITYVFPKESWITVAEWMEPGCEKYGSNNSVYVARICAK